MFRSAVLLFVVLFGVSAVYGIPPKQLEFTQSYQERLHKFAGKFGLLFYIHRFLHLFN